MRQRLLTGARWFVAATVLVCGASRAWAATNLLNNPGFENGLNDWNDAYGVPAEVTQSVVHSGAAAATKTIDVLSGQDYWSQLSQDTTAITAGQPVYAAAYLKTTFSPLATARVGIEVMYLDGNNNPIGSSLQSDVIGGQTDWRLVEASAPAAPAGTAKVRLIIFVSALKGDTVSEQGNAYMDDAVLEKSYQPPQPQTELLNPGFENGLNDWADQYGGPATIVSTGVHGGAYAARKSVGSVNNQDYWSQLYQELALAAGNPAYASVFVKTTFPPQATARAGLLMQFLTADGALIGSVVKAQDVGGQTDWTQLQVSVEAAPAQTATVRVNLYLSAAQHDTASLTGNVSFDDAEFQYAYIPIGGQSDLANPGFENGLTGWTHLYGVPAFVTSDPVHSGALAAGKAVGTVSGQDYWSQLLQSVDLQPGEPVYGSVYVKTTFSPLASARAGLLVQFKNGQNQTVGIDLKPAPVGGQADWRKLEVSKAAAPAGTATVDFSGFVWAAQNDVASLSGNAYFDDALFVNAFLPPLPQTELLNGGFENGLNDWLDLYGFLGTVETQTVHSGSYAAKKTVEKIPGISYWSQLSQDLACGAKKHVTAKLWVRTLFDSSKPRAGLLMQFLNANGKVIQQKKKTVKGHQDWEQLTVSKKKSPSKTVKVRVSAFIYAPKKTGSSALGDPAYYDDVQVTIH